MPRQQTKEALCVATSEQYTKLFAIIDSMTAAEKLKTVLRHPIRRTHL